MMAFIMTPFFMSQRLELLLITLSHHEKYFSWDNDTISYEFTSLLALKLRSLYFETNLICIEFTLPISQTPTNFRV
jgi:hypothetical protein